MKQRRSMRLRGYDYAKNGCYFVTIDVQDKLKLFWDGDVINEVGLMVGKCWWELVARFEIGLDKYVVMPDHMHGIVVIPPGYVGAGFMPARNGATTMPPARIDMATTMPSAQIDRATTRVAHTLNQEFMPARIKLGEIIGAFKSIVTKKYIDGVANNNWPRFHKRLWQRNYFERIIRNELELERTRKYIINNPKKWGK